MCSQINKICFVNIVIITYFIRSYNYNLRITLLVYSTNIYDNTTRTHINVSATIGSPHQEWNCYLGSRDNSVPDEGRQWWL